MGLGLSQYLPTAFFIIGILCALTALFYKPVVGIFFLIPLLPYASVLEKFKAYPFGKQFLNISVLCIVLGWFFHRGGQAARKSGSDKTDLNLPIFLLVLSSTFGVINGLVGWGSFELAYVVDWKDYILLPLIWFLITQVVKDRKTLGLFTLVLIIGVLGVDYYFYSNLKWMNLWHFSYKVRDTFSGIFMYLGANHYGAFFVHFMFILLGILLFTKSKFQKIGLTVLIGLTLYCMMYTFSRGAYVAFMAGIVFVGFIKERRILLLLVLFVLFWKVILPVSVVERVEMTTTENGQLEESAGDRVILWQRAWEMFIESPLYGKGFNTFSYLGYIDTHNYYLKMLAEQGVIGLITFLYLLFAAFKVGWALYKSAEDDLFKGLGFGFATCVISVAVTNFFGNRWSYLSLGSYFWAFMGITTSALLIRRREITEEKKAKAALELSPDGASAYSGSKMTGGQE